MNRNETKLLVENWRILLKKSEEDFILEESVLKNISYAALCMIGSILGGMADVEVASAMPPHEIASELDAAFGQNSPGVFKIAKDENGNVVGKHIRTGKEQLILTPEQCDNVSSSELRKAINTLQDEGYIKYKVELMKAAEKIEAEVKADQSPSKRSYAERINSIDDKDLNKIIAEFTGSPGEDGKNMSVLSMQYAIASQNLLRNDPVFKDFRSEKVVTVYLIMQYHEEFRPYLPSR